MTRLALVAMVAGLMLAGEARGHVVSDLELATLRRLPPGWLRTLTASEPLDAPVRGERAPWSVPGASPASCVALADAAAWGDSARAEAAWLGFDASFVEQRPDGGFGPPRAGVTPDPAGERAIVVWVADASRALIAVTNGGLAARFQWRYALMLPKLRRTVDRLAAESGALERDAAGHPQRLLALAQCFLLADGIYHEPAFNAIGQRALVAALARQRDDGEFVEHPRDRLGAQAVCLARLETVTQYFPAPSLERATDRAAACLARAAGGKAVDAAGAARRVAWALAYHAARRDDSELLARAVRLGGAGPAAGR